MRIAVFKLSAVMLLASAMALAGTERDDEIERQATAVDSRAAEARLASLVLHGMGPMNKLANGHQTKFTPKSYLSANFKANVRTVQAYREGLRDCLTPKKARGAGGETARSFGKFLDQYALFLSESVQDAGVVDVRMLEDYSILIRIYLTGLGTHGDRRELREMDNALEKAVVEIAHTLEARTAPSASMEEYVAKKRVENKAIPHPWTHGIKAIDLLPGTPSAKVCPSPDAVPYYSVR